MAIGDKIKRYFDKGVTASKTAFDKGMEASKTAFNKASSAVQIRNVSIKNISFMSSVKKLLLKLSKIMILI